MTTTDPRKEATRVTLVGMYLDILLGIIKIAGGFFSNSFALISDGIHSLSDAVTDIFVLVVTYFSHDEPDEEHPYGHGRFETLGTVLMGMVFFAVAGILLYDSYGRLRSGEPLPVPAWSALLLASVSILAKEWIYHYTMRTAERLNSSLLRANAWHSRSDAISSIAVFVGILGAQFGFAWLDTIAAAFVALLIARIGWQLCLDSLRELVDTAIPKQRRQEIEAAILSIKPVRRITKLRSRQSGGKVILEVEIQVDPRITVSEGHQLGEAARQAVIEQFRDINDVLVHVDPEEHDLDEFDARPLRNELLQQIREHCRGLISDAEIAGIDLHYLHHGIEVEVHLHTPPLDPTQNHQLSRALAAIPAISTLKIYHNLYEGPVPPNPGHPQKS
ncbi:MAG: cation diffusion facilitator family transporter [Pseudohongiellaceae bacterium]